METKWAGMNKNLETLSAENDKLIKEISFLEKKRTKLEKDFIVEKNILVVCNCLKSVFKAP